MPVSRVVSAYLEDISVRAFDHHPDELNSVIGGRGGIYALYKNERLYYVGLATNLFKRIKNHRRDKHKRKWNRFSAYVTKKDHHIPEMEALTQALEGAREAAPRAGSEAEARAAEIERLQGQLAAADQGHPAELDQLADAIAAGTTEAAITQQQQSEGAAPEDAPAET